MKTYKAQIVEVFSSIQGEGIFVGARQIFVRFRGCNMRCVFCDETHDKGWRDYSTQELIREVRSLKMTHRPHHSVSLTGGEPLLHTEFLKEFLRLLEKEGFRSYLETNGTLPERLAEVIDLVDIIAMDFKLPSATGEREFWQEHKKFLNIALKKKVFIKAVVTPGTKEEDIIKAASLVNKTGKDIPFILQPATPQGFSGEKVNNSALIRFMDVALMNKLESVRVIPQVHKMLNMK